MSEKMMYSSEIVEELPEHVPQELVFNFDHYDPAHFSEDPFRPFLELRNAAPELFFSGNYGGFWVATKFSHIKEVLQTPKVFSSWPMNIPPGAAWPRKLVPVELDPPDHKKYRAILAPLFTPSAVEIMDPLIRESAHELVDLFMEKEEIELLTDLARPFPTNAFLRLMGLPLSDAPLLLALEDKIMHPEYSVEEKQEAGAQVVGYIIAAIENARTMPARKDQLMSYIVNWRDGDGDGLTDEELLDMGFLMFMAGLDTVTTLFGFSFAHLAQNHNLQSYLIDRLDDTRALDRAVDELLRKFPSVNTNRTVLQDYVLGGVQLKKGDRILLPLVMANHDPEFFDAPDEVDLSRENNPQMLFGHGPHKCLGQNLGKRELRIALEVLLSRRPYFSIPEGKNIRTYGGGVMGTYSLPLCWKSD